MAVIESAWPQHPDHRITLERDPVIARAWFGDLLLAESEHALRLVESKHVDRLYFPIADVRWDLFTPADTTSICPFKGQATYWSLTAVVPNEDDIVWTYDDPLSEVAGIEGHVAFYQERVRIELEERWPGGNDTTVVKRFPVWGDARDLVRLLDVDPAPEPGHYVGPQFRPEPRNVVEGGQMLAQGLVAVAKAVPDQRVTSASMCFPKAAAFDAPLDIAVDVLRRGRTFSTSEVRIAQDDALRAVGVYLSDRGAPDVMAAHVAMPDVGGPLDAVPLDLWMTGRELRVVDGAYDPDPDRIGPPEIHTWSRYRDAPAEPSLHAALLAQSTTHWTIAAAMRPHPGIGERDAHASLSTGVMGVTVAFHDDVDVSEWHLYSTTAIYAGRGLVQGEGHVFTADGNLAASYTVQAIVRGFEQTPESMGLDRTTAM